MRTSLEVLTVLTSCAVVCGADPSTEPIAIKELWTSSGTDHAETDSLAACRLGSGRIGVFATAKLGHRLELYDAETGKLIRHIGSKGERIGQFDFPNGVVTVGFGPKRADATSKRKSFVLIIERDNARVQVFCPDRMKAVGAFGKGRLHKPYGGAVSYRGSDVFLYVTDTEVPPEQTVKVFRLELKASSSGQGILAHFIRSFGERTGKGAIAEAESVVVDDRLGRVLLCDEASSPKNVKVYTLDGRFTGTTIAGGLVKGDPEGIVLYDAQDGGFIILTDQQDHITIWHLFDRKSYAHLGAFTGKPTVAKTDGIALYTEPLANAPRGALFAVNNDADVKAYPLGDIIDLARR